MTMRIASLYLETAYSFSGSNITLETLIDTAHARGYEALALTDSKMHAAFRFHALCRAKGIHPVIGLNVRLEPLFEGRYIPILCYARNREGYGNLLKLSSLQSFHDVVSFSQFGVHAAGVSVVIPAHDGEFAAASSDARKRRMIVEEIKTVATDVYLGEHPDLPLDDVAGKRVPLDYVVYMDESEEPLYRRLRTLLKKTDDDAIPGIIDGHFKALNALQDTYSTEQLETLDAFISEHVFDGFEHCPTMPRFPDKKGLDSFTYLSELSRTGLKKRLAAKHTDQEPYRERLKRELTTIEALGYADYFLIVWDIVRHARKERILVGPGRGSAPGSLVAYALGITHVDPLAFDLVFERFLNEARMSMPDIDIDFPDRARERLIRYTVERYGASHVSLICTFGTFLKKSALRETARLFDVEKARVDETSRRLDRYETIGEMVDKDADIANRIARDDTFGEWLAMATTIEGLPKHVSTHAAGVLITAEPVTEYSAVQKGVGDHHQTQYGQDDLEKMGLLKIDYLGLRNLTMIEDILDLVREHEGKDIDPYKIPLDCTATFRLLREGSTTGIFQLESRGMRRLVKALKIESFEDIVAALALFRPGPMQSIETYIARREGREKATYVAEELEPILASTEGILLYQEQIMEIAVRFADYTFVEADLLRRAVSKKDETVLKNERKRFVEKAVKAGKDRDDANGIYDYIVTFANYGFNRSHSVAYAMIAYWMAYLKARHPACFIAVLMESALGNEALIGEYRREAARLGIRIGTPDVNESGTRFVRGEDTLYIPLNGVRNIGKAVAEGIVERRGDGRFKTFQDFVSRTRDVANRRHMEALIASGAMDVFKRPRKEMIENLDALLHYLDYTDASDLEGFVFTRTGEYPDPLLRKMQREALGFTLSSGDISRVSAVYKKAKRLDDVDVESPSEKSAWIIATVSEVNDITTKKGQKMAFLKLEDDFTSVEGVCFPDTYEVSKQSLSAGATLLMSGRMSVKKGRMRFIVERAVEPDRDYQEKGRKKP